LYALLDDSKARVRTLVAPAGYGKTTLAEQWVAREGRVAAWYTARLSSTDVAALALGIARSATRIVEDCDVRLRAHMKALPAPAENVETLAEILGEDLGAWPANAWLVLDDYHEVAEEPRAEDFVKTLIAESPLQILIGSRVRPSWITRKTIVYGEALEVNQAALAMDNREAADVLVDRSAPSASSLVLLANGWPAVIGLAGVSSAEIDADVDQVPESLYRFFADEVFNALGPEIRQGLTTLSVAPVLDGELATALLGVEAADLVCSAALDVGLLVEREQRLDLHPLARVFLEERSAQLGLAPAETAGDVCLEVYRRRREWDAAFELITRTGATAELDDLMRRALDELLDAARLPTVQRWCDAAAAASIDTAIFALARAEILLRSGRQAEAVVHAENASRCPDLAVRSLSLAGRAAHLASREEDALGFYRRAESSATSDSELRDARWGQLMCIIDLELPSSEAILLELSEGVTFGDAREVVRASANRVYFQLRQGSIDLADADVAYQVLGVVGDPLVESSFLSAYSTALSLTARYSDGLEAAMALAELADRYRFDFALAYALCGQAMALAGMRRWRDAERAASAALGRARATRDIHADLLACSVLLRLHAQEGRYEKGLRLRVGSLVGALKASIGEVIGSRALVMACAGRTREATQLVQDIAGTTTAVEPVVLIPAVEAICAIRDSTQDVVERAQRLEVVAFETGAVDLLVTTYRACPELLPVLLRLADSRRFRELVENVGDADLASVVGCPIAVNEDRRLLLSPREVDVYELLRSGLTNRQIAKTLFIEESTVKAHTHRIYDKLGVRSRSALAVQAALQRSDQATSATEGTDSSEL
jgi:DNA-binding CsgD family transcriptional regulator